MTDAVGAAEAEALLQSLRVAQGALESRPALELARLLGRVGARFLDPDDPLRLEAEARVPTEAGLSSEMARVVIEGMARDWTGDRLERLLRADFPDPGVLDRFSPGPEGLLLRAVGGRLAFHLASGSVPGVGATSLLRSLLVKSPVLLKPGAGDRALPTLFARGIAEVDPDVGEAVRVEYWRGGEESPLEAAALAGAERVVVYGDLETVSRVRSHLPPTTPFVAYHHRISFGAVSREVLVTPESARAAARDAARAVALFDQRGCVSPQLLWVEMGGRVSPEGWAELLAEALEGIGTTLPAAPLDSSTASEVQQMRGAAELRRAAGGGDRVFAGEGWTVLFEGAARPPDPCGGRTIRVSPIEELERLPRILAPHRATLQTLALAAPAARRLALAEGLAGSGITRITTFADQPWPPPWWRHDGSGPLLALVRWVTLEADSS